MASYQRQSVCLQGDFDVRHWFRGDTGWRILTNTGNADNKEGRLIKDQYTLLRSNANEALEFKQITDVSTRTLLERLLSYDLVEDTSIFLENFPNNHFRCYIL